MGRSAKMVAVGFSISWIFDPFLMLLASPLIFSQTWSSSLLTLSRRSRAPSRERAKWKLKVTEKVKIVTKRFDTTGIHRAVRVRYSPRPFQSQLSYPAQHWSPQVKNETLTRIITLSHILGRFEEILGKIPENFKIILFFINQPIKLLSNSSIKKAKMENYKVGNSILGHEIQQLFFFK